MRSVAAVELIDTQNMNKPTKVLCKRTLTSGKPFWWDEEGSVEPPDHPKRHDCENRMLIEGTWYEITKWSDDDKWFWVIDSQGNPHAHAVYTDEDMIHAPRDYSKWFYTPEEISQIEAGTYKISYKKKHGISVSLDNYHWVKQKDENGGKWIIAKPVSHRLIVGGNYWKVIGTDTEMTDEDFAEIGEMVESREQQISNHNKIKNLEELNDTIFPLIDSLRVEGTEDAQWHAPVEYHKPFAEEAVKKYFDKSWDELGDLDLFFEE